MYNIAIQRFPEDPEAQGVIRAQDDSWQFMDCSIRDLMLSEAGGKPAPEDIESTTEEWNKFKSDNGIACPR